MIKDIQSTNETARSLNKLIELITRLTTDDTTSTWRQSTPEPNLTVSITVNDKTMPEKPIGNKTNDDDILLTSPEAAELLKISTRSFYKRRSAGRLPCPVRLGRSIRWRRGEFLRWIESGMPNQISWQRINK